MEEMLERHRQELRDLRARILQKKKSATKKTRRGVENDCQRMERDVEEKHKAEYTELTGQNGIGAMSLEDDGDDATSEEHITNDIHPLTPATSRPATATEQQQQQHVQQRAKKPNRRKARLERRAAEHAAISAAAAEEASKETDRKGNEQEIMDAVFSRLGLREVDINPDGHCLYSAIALELDELGYGLKPDPKRLPLQYPTESRIDSVKDPRTDGYRAVRAVAADYMLEHKDDFQPFLDVSLYEYTRRIKLTSDWGGQLEITAISRAYGVEIDVIQSDGRIEKIDPGDGSEVDANGNKRIIWLAYFRHTYGLGEHYSALLKQT